MESLLIKTTKVFVEDVSRVKATFEKAGYREYVISLTHNNLEFHVNQITSPKKMEIEVGISNSVIESRENEQVLRELKVDATTPQTFRLSKYI